MTTPHPELIDVFTDCGCLVDIVVEAPAAHGINATVAKWRRCPMHKAAPELWAMLNRGVNAAYSTRRGTPVQGDWTLAKWESRARALSEVIAAATEGEAHDPQA